MKKLIALVLSVAMAFALAACSSGGGSAATTAAPETTAAAETTAAESKEEPAAETTAQETTEAETETEAATFAENVDLPSYKIGIICHTNSGGCWDRILDAATYVADNLNCEIGFEIGANAESCLSAAETMIGAGYNGLIFLADGGVTSRLIDMCSENGVYLVFSGCNLTVTEEEGYEEFSKNEYYCGNYSHDEYNDARTGAQNMIDNGAKNFVIYGLPPGISSNFDLRVSGAEDAIKEAGLTFNEVRSFTLAQDSPTIMSQYPDTDAIFSFVTTPDSFNVEDFAAENAGKVQVSGYMVGDVSHEFDINFLTEVCVGEEAQIEMSLAMLYNAMSGHRIADADGKAPVVDFSHLWIESKEEWDTFNANVTGGKHAYTMDEVKAWLSVYTGKDVEISTLEEVAKKFSSHEADGWLATR